MTSKNPELRFTLQHRAGLRWHTLKSFPSTTPDGFDGFQLADRMARILARRDRRTARVLLMPFNVLAVEYQP